MYTLYVYEYEMVILILRFSNIYKYSAKCYTSQMVFVNVVH